MSVTLLQTIILFVVFVAGMISCGLYMLWGRWEKGDGKRFAIAITLGLIALLPGRNEVSYDLPFHLFFSSVFAAFFFTYEFRKKLLLRIDGQMVLVWNILFIGTMLTHLDVYTWWPLYACLAVPSILTLVNAFSDVDRHFGMQVFFYFWFSAMVASVGLFHFSFGTLRVFWGDLSPDIALYELLFAGAAFLYVLVNAWYALALIPIPIGKHQTVEERVREVRRHMQLLAHGYLWKKDSVVTNVFLIVILPLSIALNLVFGLIDEAAMISIALVATGFVGGHLNIEDDGIGTPT